MACPKIYQDPLDEASGKSRGRRNLTAVFHIFLVYTHQLWTKLNFNQHPKTRSYGLQKRAEFIKESIREKLKTIPREILEQLPLEHFNLSENGVRILDRSLANKHSRGRIIDVYFKPDKVLCEYCQSNNCKHVEFALSLPEVRKILSEKGWEIRKKIKEI